MRASRERARVRGHVPRGPVRRRRADQGVVAVKPWVGVGVAIPATGATAAAYAHTLNPIILGMAIIQAACFFSLLGLALLLDLVKMLLALRDELRP